MHGVFSTVLRFSVPFIPSELTVADNSLKTVVNNNGQSTTTLWRAVRANREDRVAKLEWAANGGLGRAVIGKVRERIGEKCVRIY